MNKKILFRILLTISTIIIFLVIYNFSNQDGEESEGQSRVIANEIINKAEKIRKKEYANREEKINEFDHVTRKLAHFSLYTIAGISLMLLLNTFELKKIYKFVISVLIGFTYACSDEIHQMFIPGRTAYFTDILIDTAGIIFGCLLVMFIINIFFNRKKAENTLIEISTDVEKKLQEKK